MEKNILNNPDIIRIAFSYVDGTHRDVLEKVSQVQIFSDELMQRPNTKLYHDILGEIKRNLKINKKNPNAVIKSAYNPYLQEWVKEYIFRGVVYLIFSELASVYREHMKRIMSSLEEMDKYDYYPCACKPQFKNIIVEYHHTRYGSQPIFKQVPEDRSFLIRQTKNLRSIRPTKINIDNVLMRGGSIQPEYINEYGFTKEEYNKIISAYNEYLIEEKKRIITSYFEKYRMIFEKYNPLLKYSYYERLNGLLGYGQIKNGNILHACCEFSYYPDHLINKIDFSTALNEVDHKGYTPLHYAIKSGNFDAIIWLIEMGADMFGKIGKKSPYAYLMSMVKQTYYNGSGIKMIFDKLMKYHSTTVENIVLDKKKDKTYVVDNFQIKKFRIFKQLRFIGKIRSKRVFVEYEFIHAFNDNIIHPIDYDSFFNRDNGGKYQEILNRFIKYYDENI